MKDFKDIYELLSWEYYAEVNQSLLIIGSDIVEELMKQTQRYAYFAGIAAYAQKRFDEISSKLDRYTSIIRKQKQEQLTSSGAKVTEKLLDAYVLSLPEYKELEDEKIEASYKLNLAKNLVTALSHRKDMLIQLSANTRAETKLHG